MDTFWIKIISYLLRINLPPPYVTVSFSYKYEKVFLFNENLTDSVFNHRQLYDALSY